MRSGASNNRGSRGDKSMTKKGQIKRQEGDVVQGVARMYRDKRDVPSGGKRTRRLGIRKRRSTIDTE